MALKIGKLGFDPTNPPPGVWGNFTATARLKIRKLTQEIVQTLRKPFVTTEMEVDPKSRRMMPVDKLDTDKYNDAITDYLIEDWNEEFVDDETGDLLPKSLDSKKRIMNYLPVNDWIWGFAQAIDTTDPKN
ncbi:MAG: hypothetical protein PHS17_20090 [Desulfobacterales bacterium]|nr:hypothetical protein [Desulfobacterales bacterium]